MSIETSNEVRHYDVTMTPELAKQYLAKNFKGQRKVHERVIDDYAKDMSLGRWNHFADPGIVISEEGYLIDGQHRLLAVIRCGKNVPMHVRDNVPADAFYSIDIGCKRNVSDFLDCKNARAVAAMSRTICKAAAGSPLLSLDKSYLPVTSAAVQEYANSNMEEIQHDIVQARAIRTALGGGALSKIGFFLYTVARCCKQQAVDDFVKEIVSTQDIRIANAKSTVIARRNGDKKSGDEILYGSLEVLWEIFAGEDVKLRCLNKWSRYAKNFEKKMEHVRNMGLY